jgi:tripartite-type tricarboxylate transporter receptor subunit TctC
MVAQGQTPVGNTPEEFAANVRADLPKWGALIRDSGAKAQ